MPRRRLALAAVGLGMAVIVVVQRLGPVAGPPLFDGVIVEAPYQWLSPPPGHAGGAQGVAQSVPVQGNRSPDLGIGTSENPPQAQVFAGAGFLTLPPGTTTIQVSIAPVSAQGQPSTGVIAGNVYRFSLTNQDGQAVTGQASGGVTVELRGPLDSSNATIERYDGTRWVPLASDSVGEPNMYTAVVTDFGDFAMVAPAGWTPAPDGAGNGGPVGPLAPGGGAGSSVSSGPAAAARSLDPTPLVVVVVVAVLAGALGLLLYLRFHPRHTPGRATTGPASRRPTKPLQMRQPPPPPRRNPIPRKRGRR